MTLHGSRKEGKGHYWRVAMCLIVFVSLPFGRLFL